MTSQKTYCSMCYDVIKEHWQLFDHAACEPLPESPPRRRAKEIRENFCELAEVGVMEVKGGVGSIEFKDGVGSGILMLDGVWRDDISPETKAALETRGASFEHKARFPFG